MDIKFRCFRHYDLKPSVLGLSLGNNLAKCEFNVLLVGCVKCVRDEIMC